MEKFHAMFHGTDVYINGRYKYSSNEILTAYLNLNLSVEELTEWLFQLKAELRDLKLIEKAEKAYDAKKAAEMEVNHYVPLHALQRDCYLLYSVLGE